jgi:predicted amidohydrolase
MPETASIVTVAAIQARSVPGDTEAHLAHGTALVEEAAARGARVVVLPRFFTCGYQPRGQRCLGAEFERGSCAELR